MDFLESVEVLWAMEKSLSLWSKVCRRNPKSKYFDSQFSCSWNCLSAISISISSLLPLTILCTGPFCSSYTAAVSTSDKNWQGFCWIFLILDSTRTWHIINASFCRLCAISGRCVIAMSKWKRVLAIVTLSLWSTTVILSGAFIDCKSLPTLLRLWLVTEKPHLFLWFLILAKRPDLGKTSKLGIHWMPSRVVWFHKGKAGIFAELGAAHREATLAHHFLDLLDEVTLCGTFAISQLKRCRTHSTRLQMSSFATDLLPARFSATGCTIFEDVLPKCSSTKLIKSAYSAVD